MRAFFALLLLPLVASAQDMPLFTFTKPGEGWVKAEGKAPDREFAVLKREKDKGGQVQSEFAVGGDRFRVTYFHRLPLLEAATSYSQLERPESGHLTAAVRTADKGTVYAGFSSEPAVWAFTPDKEGKLTNGAPYAPLRVGKGYDNSKEARDLLKAHPLTLPVHELALDSAGRLYAATSQDLQVFDPTGRPCGVLSLPAKGKVDAMTWEGQGKDTLTIWIDGRKWTRAMKP